MKRTAPVRNPLNSSARLPVSTARTSTRRCTGLSGLALTRATALAAAFAARHAFRSFVPSEEKQLSRACCGLLAFLESAGTIDPLRRELIIERALALPRGSVDVEQLKIICLVLLWSTGVAPDALVLDQLLAGGEPRELH